jgi:preprotein translocase subunit SecG
MTTVPIAAVSFIMNLIVLLWVFVAVALIFIILIQKGRGGGLSSAFGGGMAGSLLGTKTTDWLTKVTIGIVLAFLLLAVVMNKYYKPKLSEQLQESTTTTTAPGESEQPQSPPLEPEVPTGQ